MNSMNNTYYINKDNQKPSKATLEDKHQVIRDIGKSGYMLKLIIGSCLILVFFLWEIFQIVSSMTKLSDQSLTNTASYSLGFSAVLGQLMNQLGIVLALCIFVTLIRAVPTVAFISIFVKSKKYNSAESLFPFLTMIQVFGVLEALIWGGLLIYDIFNFIKYQIPIFTSNGIYTMIIVVLLLIMLFKTIQGILLLGFVKYVKNYISTGECPPRPFNGMKFVIVMLSTLNAIILAFMLGSIIITQGIDLFFKSFPQLWPLYLFFFSQMFANMSAMSVLNVFKSRTRRLEYNAAPAPTAFHDRPFNSPYPNNPNTPAYQNRQNNNQFQNQQNFGGYQQNNSPFLNDQSFGSYQPDNAAPFQDIPFNGSGKPFEDLSDFNNH